MHPMQKTLNFNLFKVDFLINLMTMDLYLNNENFQNRFGISWTFH